MSAEFQQAVEFYKSGNYAMVMSRFGPVISKMKVVEPHMALIMAQSCYKLEQLGQAAEWYDRAAVPNLQNRGQVQLLAANLYKRVKNWPRALELSRAVVKAEPGNMEALSFYRMCLRTLLVFDEMRESNAALRERMAADEPGIFTMERPLDNVFWSADEAIAARLKRIDGGKPFTPESRARRRANPHVYRDRIRVAYLSNDLSDRHATMRLLQGVLLAHDQKEFEVYTLCHTDEGLRSVDQGMRHRLPNLSLIQSTPDTEVVSRIRESKVDILVDLKGHTKDPRLDILNLGAAPIQAAWLGFPGIPTGIDVDYVIGDAIVTPDSSKPYWDAQFCRLPETYQSNDDTYRALPPAKSKAELGLPEDKVVFASFNSVVKISPECMDLWMRILRGAPDAVLWILCEKPDAQRNLLKEVARAGIDTNRIFFAPFEEYPEHVARLQAADVAIDTFPCNGHTTTSDKLWAGLPLATMKGTSFASRVSESLLGAIGMEELVASDDEAYVALNIRLATDAAYRSSLRERIVANRFRAPLFDTERFTRHLENAFRMMVDRARKGLPPEAFDVPALPPRTEPFKV